MATLTTTQISAKTAEAVAAARATLDAAVARAQAAAQELRTALEGNPALAKAADRASGFIAEARARVAAAAETVTGNPAVADALAKATEALAAFTAEAKQLPTALSARAEAAVARTQAALAQATAAVATWQADAYSFAKRKLSDLDAQFQVTQRSLALGAAASVQVKALDAQYKIGEAATKLAAKAQELDTTYGVTATALAAAKKAQEVGDSLTGARVTPAVDFLAAKAVEGYAMGLENLQQVKTAIENQEAAQAQIADVDMKKSN